MAECGRAWRDGRRRLGLTLLAWTLGACSRDGHNAAEIRDASAGTASSANSIGSVAPPPSPAVPPTQVVHCKALGKKGNIPVGSVRDQRVQLLTDAEHLYVLGHTHELARVRLLRLPRSGGEFETIGEQSKAINQPSRAVVHGGAAYYTQAGTLYRLGPESGPSTALHMGADSPPTVEGQRAYVVDCDRTGKTDRVLEVPLDGGVARTLAEIPHKSSKRCEYSSLVADRREVLIADWNGQRILAVERATGNVRELIRHRGFVQELMLEPNSLSFVSGRGLERADRNGNDAKVLVSPETVLAPWSRAQVHSGEYWFTDDIAYTSVTHIYRMPARGGKPQSVVQFGSLEPAVVNTAGDAFLLSYAVDDECVYFVREVSGQGRQLLARAK